MMMINNNAKLITVTIKQNKLQTTEEAATTAVENK